MTTLPVDKDICFHCKKRKATLDWGDALALTHGMTQRICEICLLEIQIPHAVEVAERIPAMEKRLAELKAAEAG